MFPGVLTDAQQTLLGLLSPIREVRTFYLAGGTALAPHLGHGRSGGLDFFRAEEFAPPELLAVLRDIGELEVLGAAAGTLTVALRGVPSSFFCYDYPLLRSLQETPWGLPVADAEDIAAMKLAALAGRGSRKDFVDLYFHACRVAPLEHTLQRFREKSRGVSVDPNHLLRSLTFFDDAEAEAMPELVEVTWDEIKAFFKAKAVRLFHSL